MLKYLQFDINKNKKSNKFKIFVISFIIIILLVYNIYINIDTKDDVKIISTNSRRIINNLNNYTETMSDFMVSNINDIELTEIQNIRLSIDYFKELKEQELKEKELKELKEQELKELKEQKLKELKEQELKELKEKELKELKEKAIKLIKSYIPEFNSLINLVSTHQIINKYIGEVLDISCIKEIIRINSEEIFNKLINIDYDKLEVSFNYLDINEEYYKNTDNIITTHLYTDYDKNNQYYNYSHYIYRNFKENIIKNPIYKNIKDRLEIDYSYTEPNLTDEYNNKSKYFSKSLEGFINKNYYVNTDYYKKYYENYYNDTYYINYINHFKNTNYQYYSYYLEIILNNEIIINNPNPIEIYNKHPFKNICGISSMSLNRNVDIHSNYLYSESVNYFPLRNTPVNNLEEIEKELNNDYISNYDNYNIDKEYPYSYSFKIYNQKCNNEIWGFNKYSYELEKNKGSRMVKHNLTNNIPEHINIIPSPNYYSSFVSNYFIEKVFIDFPLISIYDEYDYIEKILNDYKIDIYNLPIIPPIKFM